MMGQQDDGQDQMFYQANLEVNARLPICAQ
jgi:hypothetical protein